ncbi:hypothetical protein V496_00352 [Pseudogymnoascus sp. VKM F-4515 (FW-2607)]|nr:hypothetical protein V496_00352 [Pseudogymnoascus sp. VKM F-4515 (FW-2607)]KFY98551.1 hypothetical protein V498_01401 [Pseudogymnoascus sp. VKM F-4517 (FW-2822)]
MDLRPRLDGIPMEIMENIVTLLALSDTCSLRLTGREVSTKSSQGIFKSHFRNKTITTSSTEQLHRAVSMTQRQGFGCLLEHLTLVGLPKSRNPKDAAVLLGQTMKNLRLGLAGCCLPSLSLVIADGVKFEDYSFIEDSSSWQSVWETAAECFEASMRALSVSEIPIESLDVFSGVTCCSLSLDRLATIQDLNLSASLQRLKRLSMSLSHHMVYDLENRESEESEEMQALTTGERNTRAICKFLQHCPVLEDLQLHWYTLRTTNLTNAISEEELFFDRVAQSCQFPFLKRCTLKGIRTSAATLLSFLRQMQLNSIEMEEIQLQPGEFRLVFDYLVKHMEQLEHVHLNDLWERRLIYFDAPGEPHFPGSEPPIGPNTLTRTGTDARMPIKYQYSRGYALGSVKASQWRRKKDMQYGPPSE